MIHYIYKLNEKDDTCVKADICNLQANKYFERILDILIKIFQLYPELNNKNNILQKKINECKEISASITQIKKIRSSESNKNKNCDKYNNLKIIESFDNIMKSFIETMKYITITPPVI
jgi:hypothetical protein